MTDLEADQLRRIYADTKTIAVVGISTNPDKDSHSVPQYLQSHGYRIFPVNPTGGEILGEKVYSTLGEIDVPIDAVDVFRPPAEAASIAADAAAAGAKVLWFQPDTASEEGIRIGEDAGLTVVAGICMRATHIGLGLSVQDG